MNCPRCDSPAETQALQQFGGVCPKCLLEFAAERDAPSFPNLEIVSTLGEGGMGVVYKAVQKPLGRTVALKVLSPQLAADPAFVERFTREAKALASLNHPNIVAIHDFGVHDHVPYLIMEFVDGTPLRKLLAAKKLTAEQALDVVPQICDALQYAHARGVVHRDVKPENILIDREGRVKIADFGLAKLAEVEQTRITRTNMLMGTPHYMAPEQIENPSAVDHRADIYSLGVIFYEMLTGELPLGRFKPPSAKAPVDRRLDPVVLKSLEKEPGDRYQAAQDVKDEVTRVQVDPHGRIDTPPDDEVEKWVRKFDRALIAIFLIGVGATALALVQAARSETRGIGWIGVVCATLALALPLLVSRMRRARAAVERLHPPVPLLPPTPAPALEPHFTFFFPPLIPSAILLLIALGLALEGERSGAVWTAITAGMVAVTVLPAVFKRRRSPVEPRRRGWAVVAGILAGVVCLIAILLPARSESRTRVASVTRVPSPPVLAKVPPSFRPFRLAEAWPGSDGWPNDLETREVDQKAATSEAALPEDLLKDVREIRRCHLIDRFTRQIGDNHRCVLTGIEFNDEAARIRWEKTIRMPNLQVRFLGGPTVVWLQHDGSPEAAKAYKDLIPLLEETVRAAVEREALRRK